MDLLPVQRLALSYRISAGNLEQKGMTGLSRA